jgi:hypothetical protein
MVSHADADPGGTPPPARTPSPSARTRGPGYRWCPTPRRWLRPRPGAAGASVRGSAGIGGGTPRTRAIARWLAGRPRRKWRRRATAPIRWASVGGEASNGYGRVPWGPRGTRSLQKREPSDVHCSPWAADSPPVSGSTTLVCALPAGQGRQDSNPRPSVLERSGLPLNHAGKHPMCQSRRRAARVESASGWARTPTRRQGRDPRPQCARSARGARIRRPPSVEEIHTRFG